MKLLVMEDNNRLAENIRILLKHEAYAVDTASSGEEAKQKIADEPYDLIILDRMLPDYEGALLCREIRADNQHVPILMLTAKTQIQDKVEGLDAGADDYLTKPFESDELLARVRVLLRRVGRLSRNPVITLQGIVIDTNNHTVTWKGKQLDLTPKEYGLLEYLALHEGQALTRDQLLSHVWDENADPFSNTVDVHVAFLRSKLKKNKVPFTISTVKGVGYLIKK